jgi:hypothetical protein
MVVELGLISATAAIDLHAAASTRLDVGAIGKGYCCVVTIPADD